ncbi:MAG: hypothetical protein WA996_10200 [Candidatus Promineifilaceae bacterium]
MCESNEWRDWSGFLVAGTYEPAHEREYFSIRNTAGLIDISPLYKYDVTGPDALRLINKMVTRDLSNFAIDQIKYSPWCDEAGKIIDVGTVWRLSEGAFRITAADPNLRWLQDCGFGKDAEVIDGQMDLGQLLSLRPVPGYGSYRTPFRDLYLCEAGAHPGGGVTGTPGKLAPKEILDNLG